MKWRKNKFVQLYIWKYYQICGLTARGFCTLIAHHQQVPSNHYRVPSSLSNLVVSKFYKQCNFHYALDSSSSFFSLIKHIVRAFSSCIHQVSTLLPLLEVVSFTTKSRSQRHHQSSQYDQANAAAACLLAGQCQCHGQRS